VQPDVVVIVIVNLAALGLGDPAAPDCVIGLRP